MAAFKEATLGELIEKIRNRIAIAIRPFINIKKYWKILSDDVSWDVSDIVLDFLETKLRDHYEFCKSDKAVCEHIDDIKDYFTDCIKKFYKWLMNKFDEKNNEDKILRSIRTYIYCIELLKKVKKSDYGSFDEELQRLQEKCDREMDDSRIFLENINQNSKTDLSKLMKKSDEIEKKCYKLLAKMFETRAIESWWD